jgi:cyclic pyranopterin monophosphate synthase
MKKLSHVSSEGKAKMVDVSNKPDQLRIARAAGHITLLPETIKLVRENKMKKGDVLTVAEIAGIQGGKKTSELIPLCHPLQITKIDVKTSLDKTGVFVESEARCVGKPESKWKR